ncbi:glutamic acid-rich protein [Diachasma alloeum]|uniref:glutamic acid-rich protein n=1 Tax=Diachasma alloeum TaxID=454923 RepID=UPI0007383F16|nr:glutamic acid-rich protein [Diachasma alloeum]
MADARAQFPFFHPANHKTRQQYWCGATEIIFSLYSVSFRRNLFPTLLKIIEDGALFNTTMMRIIMTRHYARQEQIAVHLPLFQNELKETPPVIVARELMWHIRTCSCCSQLKNMTVQTFGFGNGIVDKRRNGFKLQLKNNVSILQQLPILKTDISKAERRKIDKYIAYLCEKKPFTQHVLEPVPADKLYVIDCPMEAEMIDREVDKDNILDFLSYSEKKKSKSEESEEDDEASEEEDEESGGEDDDESEEEDEGSEEEDEESGGEDGDESEEENEESREKDDDEENTVPEYSEDSDDD